MPTRAARLPIDPKVILQMPEFSDPPHPKTPSAQKPVQTLPCARAAPDVTSPDVAGTAALAICESLLLALMDRNILSRGEISGLLEDAAAVHEQAQKGPQDALHQDVARLINEIRTRGNTVRRS